MLTTQSPEFHQFLRERDIFLAREREDERRAIDPDPPAHAVLQDGAWRGERCFIIGGGPSLYGFDFERLRGRGRVIVINKGFYRAMFADVLFFMDHASFYNWIKRGQCGPEIASAWREFKGLRVFLNLKGRRADDAVHVRSLGRVGLSPSLRRGLFHGSNCGVGALGLAVCLGADPVYLLGYDLRHEGRKTHWHGGYGRHQPPDVLTSYRHELERTAEFIRRRGRPRVVNLNPRSALRAFPFGKIEEVLHEN